MHAPSSLKGAVKQWWRAKLLGLLAKAEAAAKAQARATKEGLHLKHASPPLTGDSGSGKKHRKRVMEHAKFLYKIAPTSMARL